MKKYSDKFLNYSHLLKDAIIGFEFEFYLKDFSYYKTLEVLNQELSPVKVWGFRQYHSSFQPDSDNFKMEPDLSGGANMVELITGPMEYFTAKFYLIKILNFIDKYGYTNNKCAVHFNVSFEEKDLNDLNILKLILSTDEDEIFKQYPTRRNNIYAKSVMNIIPYKDYDFYNISSNTIKNNLALPDDKYYGINFKNIINNKESQRVEFRYIGGKDYHKNSGLVLYFLDKFIVNTSESIDTELSSVDVDKLEDFLKKEIEYYKNLSSYDRFLTEIPHAVIQVNQDNTYDLVKSYYERIYEKINSFIHKDSKCIINFVTVTNKIEIVDLTDDFTIEVKNIDFINCKLSGMFSKCQFIKSDVKNSLIKNSKIHNSDVLNTKVLNCEVDASLLSDCYFSGGYLNGEMDGGVWRSGKLGPYAELTTDVKIISKTNNFFFQKFDEEDEKMDIIALKKEKGK